MCLLSALRTHSRLPGHVVRLVRGGWTWSTKERAQALLAFEARTQSRGEQPP